MEAGFLISATLVALVISFIEFKIMKEQGSTLVISAFFVTVYTNLPKYLGIDETITLYCVLILGINAVMNMIIYHHRRNRSIQNGTSDEEIIKTFGVDNNRYLIIMKLVWIVIFIHLITVMYEGSETLRYIFVIIMLSSMIIRELMLKNKYLYMLVIEDVAMVIYIVYFLAPTGELAPVAISIQLILAHIPFFFTDELNDKINSKLLNFSKKRK
ncbi:hypothetical protein [Tannockella kyphosi]|uniref:hypothetical protein n=1 Tax=Tannockella kyphosi TaxID=2899121 RepID=UPI00201396D0|nr:hypothetical protein [Tannockella kyphosi]